MRNGWFYKPAPFLLEAKKVEGVLLVGSTLGAYEKELAGRCVAVVPATDRTCFAPLQNLKKKISKVEKKKKKIKKFILG